MPWKSPAIFDTKEMRVLCILQAVIDRLCVFLTRHTCNINRFSAAIFFSMKSIINFSIGLSLSLHLSICLFQTAKRHLQLRKSIARLAILPRWHFCHSAYDTISSEYKYTCTLSTRNWSVSFFAC